MLQLLCLPEPFTPAKGFSWSRQARPWRLATRLSTSMVSTLWSHATLSCSKTGAISYWEGATSQWRLLAGTPRR
ncbi:hypothetical protein D3C72_1151550 [compost metagenome]